MSRRERSSAYDAALRLLARREHSRYELHMKLRQRDYPEQEIEPALDALAAREYLSDARFAQAYLRERVGRGYGELRIRGELRERGVSEACVDHAVAHSEADWDAVLRRVYESRFDGEPRDRRDWLRRAGFLQGRGFEAEQIRRLLGAW